MIEKIRGKVKEIFNLVGSFLARIPAYLIPIVASVVLVIVLCVLVLCLSDKWESCIPSKMVPDYKEVRRQGELLLERLQFLWHCCYGLGAFLALVYVQSIPFSKSHGKQYEKRVYRGSEKQVQGFCSARISQSRSSDDHCG